MKKLYSLWVLLFGFGLTQSHAEDNSLLKFISTPVTQATVSIPYRYEIVAMNKTDQVLNYSALTLPAWLTLNTPKAIIVDVAPEFQELAGIAVDNQGNIYASDSKGNSVYKIAADGLELARWSQCENNNFVSLGDISIDASGNSYFMDKDISFRVCRINTENQTRIVFPTPIQISSIAQGSLTVQGNYIYMIDSSDQRCITKIDKFNSTSTFIPENCDDMTIQFTEPAGIAIDAHNHIYVADQGAHCIRKVTPDSVQAWAGQCDTPGYADGYGLQAQFTAPSKITIDVQGNMYVIDNSKRIRKINLNTEMVTTLIDSANHAFETITDIAVGLEGRIYLTDSITNKIYKLTATQVSLTGMPSRRDIGVHPVSLKAQAGSESISDSFNIHVTSTPAPPPFAGYLSLPAPTTPLDFGETVVNVPVTQTLKIRENGNLPLLVELIGISGEQAHEFKIVSPEFPLVLHDGDSAIEITLQCVPTQIGLSTATLMLATNTQDKPTPHYPLTCVGQAPPGYASEPPIGTKLTIAKKAVGHTGVNSFIIKETGGADLIVDIVGITGPHAEDFEVIAPLFPLTISNNDPSATVRVRCLHFDPGLLHEATLTLSTNDPLNPLPSYPLECLGIEAGYGSTPAPESHLDFGSTALNVAVRQAIQVNNAGEQPLTLQSAELYGAHHEDFQLIAPDFPLILDKGEDTEIIVACQPTQTGSRTASLQLNGTDEMQSRYHFSCQGRAEVITAGYASTPPVASVIDFGRTSLTSSVTQTLTIAEVGQVDLEVNLASLEGPQAAAFSISADESIILANDAEPLSLMITCRPVSAGLNTAHLVFTTNDPQNPAPSYELNCYAEATPQSVHYDSLPAPGSQLAVFDSTATPTTEASTSAQLTVMTQGSSPLEISSSALMGEQAEYFHIITGEAPFTVLEEGQAHTLTLQCTASKNHAREAQLILTTNDPKHPTVHYDLICEATQNILFRGEIRTQSGVVSDEVSIDAPEIFTVVGYIYPQAEHIGQKADIKMIYHWQPTDEERVFTVPVTIAEDKLLEEVLELTLFQGSLMHLSGQFQVDLSYQIGEMFFSAPIAQLTIAPNRPPTDITLSAHTIAENSGAETPIGLLQGIDPDQGEWFMYGLMDDAEGRFKIVNNSLRVAPSAQLDYERYAQHQVTVRAIDAAGGYFEKTFTLQVIDQPYTPLSIQLTHNQVQEHSPEHTIIGRLITEDPEQGHYQYQLLDDAGGRFKLVDEILMVANGALLDFEQASQHQIMVSSQELTTQVHLEQRFDIELINIIDIQVNELKLVNTQGQRIDTAIENTQPVSIQAQLQPDATHQGETVALLGVLVYEQSDNLEVMQLTDHQWQPWNGDLAALTPINTLTLKEKQDLILWQGPLTVLKPGPSKFFLGYRLKGGEVVYSAEPLSIQIQ